MYLVPKCHITIGSLKFDWSHEIEINSSWKLLTDTAIIKLPANVKLKSDVDSGDSLRTILDHIPFGALVKIELSAHNNMTTLFQGYVTEIMSKVPIVLQCEDEMRQLKKDPITDSGKKQTLKGLLLKNFTSYKTNTVDIELGNYQIDNATRAQFLKQIQSDFGVYSFFRNGVLTIGKQYDSSTQKQHTFNLDRDVIVENLEYKSADQIKLNVTAISHLPNGEKLEVQIGELDGEKRTLNFYNVPEAELKATAEREMVRFKYDGWRGDFTALGLEIVTHGDIVTLQYISKHLNKSSKYYVDSVTYSFGVGGFRQKIELGLAA